ncbi:MAG: hypothetical protein IKQ71_11150 [Lachnospiraceae bacterium]|nr:hypothetical protein [Lachnospiraceae bacterium]
MDVQKVVQIKLRLEYRVLQKDTTEFSEEDASGNKIEPYTHTMFLDSDILFANSRFMENGDRSKWKESLPYKWLNVEENGIYNSTTYLTAAEKAVITESYKRVSPIKRDDYVSLTGEKVFIPDLSDVICSAYGYYGDQAAHHSSYRSIGS